MQYKFITIFVLLLSFSNIFCKIGSGIHDAIMAMSREDLIKWAFAAEKYHNEKNNINMNLGGLHDKIHLMTDNNIREYIMDEVEEHKEIDSTEVMNGLVKRFHISEKIINEKNEDNEGKGFGRDGGLMYVLATANKEELIKYALALEKYHFRDEEQKAGGLHDYIFRWSREEIVDYISRETDEHQEIKNLGKLKKLIDEYSKKNGKFLEEVSEVEEHLKSMKKEQLMELVLSVEKYLSKKTGTSVLGGLHDYVRTLSKNEIIAIIKVWSNEHPELNSKEFLNSLMAKKK